MAFAVAAAPTIAAGATSKGPALQRNKIAADLLSKIDAGRVAPDEPIIVSFTTTPTADVVKAVKALGKVVRPLASINSLSARMSGQALATLSADARIASISPDRDVRSSMDIAGPAVGNDLVRQSYNLTGKGVTVAMLDSGIAAGPDLSARRVVAAVDLVDSTSTGSWG
ncbi:MAG: hypothetical protein DMF49_07975 [Acidobacteria bacterium]|nr:MAG: hypothetical protein DMF49_07975 [Acidobacteriota bacterium]